MPMNLGSCGGDDYWSWLRVDDGKASTCTEYNTSSIVCEFIEWWSGEESPRFAMVAFAAPHGPLHLPPEEALPPGWPRDPSTNRDYYVAMVRSMDHAVQKILDWFVMDRTLVVFLGDNGTPPECLPSDGSWRRAKATTFESGINVPLIASAPGVPCPQTTNALVHAVDVLATFAEYVGYDLSGEGLDSVSFLPVLEDPSLRPRAHLYCAVENRLYEARDEAIVTERYKLRRFAQTRAGFEVMAKQVGAGRTAFPGRQPELRVTEELYDLITDPYEMRPLRVHGQELAVVADLLRRLLP
jgi:arylsulfatase A-like enzyme